MVSIRLLLFVAALIRAAAALNILVFLLGTSQPERATMEHVAQQLALRHHTVVTIKPILIPEEPRLVKQKLHLVREKTMKNLLHKSMFQPLEKAYDVAPWLAGYDYDDFLVPYYAAHNASCSRIINSDLVDGLRKDNLDVALVYAGNPCQLAVAHVLGVPTVYFDLDGLTDETLVASGSPLDVQYPLSHCRLASQLSSPLVSRLAASACFLSEITSQSGVAPLASIVSRRYRQMDGPITKQFREDYTFKKRFPSFPDVNTLKQRATLYFVNSDPLLEYERALPPHVIPVGGIHMEHPKPLFSPWNETIAQSKEGTIVVSFGTLVNNAKMSESQAAALYGALSQLTSYRIIWNIGAGLKLPGIDVDKAPAHMNITAYLPQNDVLADKRTKLLITNGGMSSLMEAVAYGVPVVGVPLYGVNKHNLDKVAHKGLGVVLQKSELSQTNLLQAIRTVLDSAKYKTVAKDMAREFKARHGKEIVFERAMHYIEHVGRHHAAAFYRPKTDFFTPLRQLSIETTLLLLLILGGPLALAFIILNKSLSALFSSRATSIIAESLATPVKKTKAKAQ
ncbi:ugt-57 [Pristionchus pacificus]|uniref:glucuronosyltransferase n=1 Tax=Pristionchus pacificus TaxID=54126 RepID=A0A2A6BAJ4_PRIPA|nr:ugt-57 [Pristionchus pacificus]|eukprot:PDM62909.1 ugt-57 [Pristionchus pacificus]